MAMTPQIFSISGLATEIGCDRRAVAKALSGVKPDGKLKGKPGWRLATALAAMRKNANGNGHAEEPTSERERLAKEQADNWSLRNAALRGEFLDAVAVERRWSDTLRTVRAGMLSVPTRAAARLSLSPADAAVIDRIVRDVLDEVGHGSP